ncbi:MAG: class I SAM-dependent methyltransferase [Bacteroidota bacterium]|nr:class I SAM-dependent methyltransferase [Bacteroidota bacterium]MDP4218561.1 class I SAM-dependent methyltransferase [Bacteroidota bacterium]MDP4248298.1 class I SAM-dependent methyltransferase [Bacteroidota bacterium]MDP4253253.1 class I SAM-dependent methyltransferase [Bacteroidota bacterium]MDP4259896.1 class I SAM-dependent methyltransferase [Bacteroidota bacterium]
MIEIGNPAFDYDRFGGKYSSFRQTDERIAQYVHKALSGARTVLNVGAGAGSYEPEGKYIVAVEPSVTMRQQRMAAGKAPAINAKADNLPFDDNAFDASMAMVTVHHWPDMDKGLKEIRRVTKQQVVIMTFDPQKLDDFWVAEYFPEVVEVEKARYPTIEFIRTSLGGRVEITSIPIPLDCKDGFQEAFYGRPEAFLQKEIRLSQSAWGFISDDKQEEIVNRLRIELQNGNWNKKYGHYRTQPSFTCGLTLVISTP